MNSQQLTYLSPFKYAKIINEMAQDFVLLHSSLSNDFTGRYSYLAFGTNHEIISDNFAEFENVAKSFNSNIKDKFANNWFGFLSYDLKNSLEKLVTEKHDSFISLPNLWLVNFNNILEFDHNTQTVTLYSKDLNLDLNIFSNIKKETTNNVTPPEVEDIKSNMNKETYLKNVEVILDKIRIGEIYQANLTRKFYGHLKSGYSPLKMFEDLCTLSPSPYSAFIKFKDNYILSSSPEQFLSSDNQGNISTRPIKGSAPRFADKKLDLESYENLKNSPKEQAENLMIVDLMRNDLAKISLDSSVKVKNMFEISAYKTIYQMSSTITALKKANISSLEVVKACFPPGSMTGAPKISAMNICSQLEQQKRGLYSGAIGYFLSDGTVDLSVVIRTLIIKDNKFEFQVGGGIVADSNPIKEWQETMIKAKAILQLLNLHLKQDLIF